MFEYTLYPSGDKVTVNPNFVTYIKYEDESTTRIGTSGGTHMIVEETYEKVSQAFKNYIYR